MGVRIEVLPFLGVALLLAVVLAAVCRLLGMRAAKAARLSAVIGIVAAGYFLYFFRDPPRTPPADASAIVAAKRVPVTDSIFATTAITRFSWQTKESLWFMRIAWSPIQKWHRLDFTRLSEARLLNRTASREIAKTGTRQRSLRCN